MSVGLDVTGHMEPGGKSVRYYIEMQQEHVHFGFNGRYSELRHLHAHLLGILKNIDKTIELPPFPSKHLMENMKSQSNIRRRRDELFEYYTLVGTNALAVDWLAGQYEARTSLDPHEAEKDRVEFTIPIQKHKKQRSHRSSRRSGHERYSNKTY